MNDALHLLKLMAEESSGISEYWRSRIISLINQIPQQPRVMTEVVEE